MIIESPLVSVIIPVYNCEKFIRNCIQSVIQQTYKNIEIIVVNDGSLDGSRIIINELKQTDSRIVVVEKQKNEGLALARKSGSIIAKGKYIQHLDGDDSLFEDAIERLVSKAEQTHADIVTAPFYFCYQGKEPLRSVDLQFEELSGKEYFNLILTERAYWSVWSNFRRKDLEDNYQITIFPEISIIEDAVMMVQLILNANKVVAIQEPILYYNKYDFSITAQMNELKYMHIRMIDAWIRKYVEAKGLRSELAYGLAQRQLRVAMIGIHWCMFQDASGEIKRLISNLEVYPGLCSLLTRKEKAILRCYCVSPSLVRLALFCHKIKMKVRRLLKH